MSEHTQHAVWTRWRLKCIGLITLIIATQGAYIQTTQPCLVHEPHAPRPAELTMTDANFYSGAAVLNFPFSSYAVIQGTR